MMPKLFFYILFFLIAPLYSANTTLETITSAITTAVKEASATSIEHMPANTNVTNVESTTVAPVLDPLTTTNTSDSTRSSSTETTPLIVVPKGTQHKASDLTTTKIPNTEHQTTTDGSLGLSNTTTIEPVTSQSTATVPDVENTTNAGEDKRSTTSNITQGFSTLQSTAIAISPNDTSITNRSLGTGFSTLRHSEAILTSIFSTILVIVILAILILIIKKYRRRRLQYAHHPLREHVYESVDRYSAPEDTLVISGGLYEAPRVYNPNMTVLEDDDLQHDYVSFSSRPGQFRLEFLPAGNDPRVH